MNKREILKGALKGALSVIDEVTDQMYNLEYKEQTSSLVQGVWITKCYDTIEAEITKLTEMLDSAV